MEIILTDKQFINAYRSAGLWFVALYMEAFIVRKEAHMDSLAKRKLIEEIYNDGDNTFDKGIDATRTRVNSLIRIIRSGRASEALEIASLSDRLHKEFPEAAETAGDLLLRIDLGKFDVS